MRKLTVSRPLRALLAGSLLALLSQSNLSAETEADRFYAWLRELKPAALSAGVSDATFERTFAGLAPDCAQTGVFCEPVGEEPDAGPPPPPPPSWTERTGLPKSCEKVPQREFLEPAAYFPENYLRRLVRRGQEMLEDFRANKPDIYQHILKIEATHGVPVPILMGLWARETALGEATLNHNTVIALASLAYAGHEHRRPWMRQQLIAALKMLENGDVTFEEFRSSWAGATGQTQIMPGEYLRFAVDGDGDGRKDIWKSAPDSLATTANILRDRGWSAPGWGRQVRVPQPSPNFDCTLEGRASMRPVSSWMGQAGITPADRPGEVTPPPLAPDQPVWLLLPGGASGPAFLVTENFDVLREYNPSDLYALFIGVISDRLGCDTADRSCVFERPWPASGPGAFPFSVENICRLQLSLKEKGHLHGNADGLFGPQTRAAIGRYQKAQGAAPTCYPSQQMLDDLTRMPRTEAMHKDGAPAVP